MTDYTNMSLYQNLRKFDDVNNDRERLMILRHEMLRPITTIQGWSTLAREMNFDCNEDDLAELKQILERISVAGNEIGAILEALTAKYFFEDSE